ncbi:hypothetical protein AB1Y20_003685 [Prymnesium parvum]|uniref:DNL-type domain-containing protein n=1 Tax=Prymnesium parvum TaxID=97485 RepID=A0AB34J7R7_PRYPA
MLRRVLLASPPLHRAARARRPLSSVDEALRSVLSRVAERVQKADPRAELQAEIPGVRTPGPKMILRFTCTHPPCVEESSEEERTTTRLISKKSYEQGIVIVRCQACENQHLIADNFGWFGDAVNIEQMMAERGEEVQRILLEDPDSLHLPSRE